MKKSILKWKIIFIIQIPIIGTIISCSQNAEDKNGLNPNEIWSAKEKQIFDEIEFLFIENLGFVDEKHINNQPMQEAEILKMQKADLTNSKQKFKQAILMVLRKSKISDEVREMLNKIEISIEIDFTKSYQENIWYVIFTIQKDHLKNEIPGFLELPF